MDKNLIRQPFWSMSIEETFRVLEGSRDGITVDQAKTRRSIFGVNEIRDGSSVSSFKLLINQFRSPLILILVFAGATTIFLKDWIDSGIIFGAIFINVFLGFYQENKAENILELLKSYVRTRARVQRPGGKEEIVDATMLVPGDVIRVGRGDKIPADARIIFVNNFEVDESVLTGESLSVSKKIDQLSPSVELADRDSMIFGGSLAVRGYADAVVVATGSNTEFGRIASLISKKEKSKTPLQSAISNFAFWIGLVLLILTVFLFGGGIFLGHKPLDMFLIAVAVAVSAVPESLPIALTVIMAVGVEHLAKRKGVVRKLLAAETLGSTSLILTDKTGTLTQAKMELAGVIPYKDNSTEKIREILFEALTTVDIVIENPDDKPEDWRTFGNIMEVALAKGAAEKGLFFTEAMKEAVIFDRLAFSSDKKFAGSVHDHRGKKCLVIFGAPDIIINFTNLSTEGRAEVIAEVDERAFDGERVLGIASKEVDGEFDGLKDENYSGMDFGGLITFRDPLRPGVFESMQKIKEAGVRTIIVTGDHKGTAESVARELGLVDGKGAVLTGDDLNHLSKDELNARADETTVFARVTPEQKVMIANLYKERGEIVAMTGDGVNDAPALEAANIGVALGSGTDVTKAAADLVILDNNYETIVVAIEEGRRILNNIRKVVVYLMSNCLDGLLLIGGSIIMGLALPINPIQILFVNFFSDSFPAIAFAFERNNEKLSLRPHRLDKNLFDGQMRFILFAVGIPSSILLLIMYLVMARMGLNQEVVRTFIFASFATYTLLVAFSLRSLRKSIFTYNPFSNLYLTGGIALGIFLTLMAVYLPPLQKILKTVHLSLPWAIGVGVFGVFNILMVEFGKFAYKKLSGDK